MKKIMSLLLAFTIILSLCACQGNFSSVDLKDAIAIPEDGMIQEDIIKQIKQDNAIGIFTGTSGELQYEWTIFGSDISDPKQINLQVALSETADGNINVVLAQTEPFGFSALLSIYLNEKWENQSATAYAGDKAFTSVALTGSKTTTLNLTLDGSVETCEIVPDSVPEDTTPPTTEEPADKENSETNNTNLGGKDPYLTDPVPPGKPQPVEPEDQDVDRDKTYTCTFSIECSTILNNLNMLDPDKLEMVPSGGVILTATTVTFYEGESVFDVLQRVCKEKGIHMEASWTPIYNSAYVEGIHNLYEFDCGALSGWMYKVNGWYPNYGSSRYQLKDGDVVEWRYTCDLGNDIGGGYAVGG